MFTLQKNTNFCLLTMCYMLYLKERGEIMNDEIHDNIEKTESLYRLSPLKNE